MFRISSSRPTSRSPNCSSTLKSHGFQSNSSSRARRPPQTLGDKLVKGSSSIVSFGGGLLTEVVSAGFDVLLVFVLSVYMLLYGESIGRLIRRYMPDGDGTPADDYPTLVQSALARYVGGQLLFSLVMGATAGVALYLLGVVGVFPDGRKYAVVLRGLLRPDGARPVHRPDPRARCRR